MSEPSRTADLLKAKAMLLIQSEREVYALRLGRERMMAWLHAFQDLSLNAQPETGLAMCATWTRAMLEGLHFQTAASFTLHRENGELSLIHGQSHTPLEPRLVLGEAALRVLRARRDGVFEAAGEPDVSELSQSLRLHRFMWFAFALDDKLDVLLVAGIAAGVSGAQRFASDDLMNFVMLGRHLAVLLSNSTLISELDAASRRLQNLFDHMRQAIVAFDHEGAIGRVSSRQARLFFEHESLEGKSIRELLYPGAPDYDVALASFDEWMQMAFATPAENWEACQAYAPREVVVPSQRGNSRLLELEFRPVIQHGKITQIMVLASDVSTARELEDAVRNHEAEGARRLVAVRRLIAGGTQVFLAFVASARARIVGFDAALGEHSELLPIAVIDELFRHAHTVRSEARAFDLTELEETTKRLEADLDELRSAARGAGHILTGSCISRLKTGIERVRQALELSVDLLIQASPVGSLIFDQTTVQKSTLRELIELTGDRQDKLGRLVARLAAVPFGLTAAGVLESAPNWAAQEGNLVALRVEPRELLVPEALAQVLPGVLAHLVRNAIAHGIEPADERRQLGKPETGTISILASETAAGICVTVEDDGRGIDSGEVMRRAGSHPEANVAELVFLPGLSTRRGHDELAGRGVGLDAVRAELASIGYDATLSFTHNAGTKLVLAPKSAAHTSSIGEVRHG
jgi:two-component system, chemotaxis family, sensor kinase CheA